jgi:ABC-type sulfate/molybdate transport systems ATPase subunit
VLVLDEPFAPLDAATRGYRALLARCLDAPVLVLLLAAVVKVAALSEASPWIVRLVATD